MKKYQFISWFPTWCGFLRYAKPKPYSGTVLFYKWSIYLGFFEIRKFLNQAEMDEAFKKFMKENLG